MRAANDPAGGERTAHCKGFRGVPGAMQAWTRWLETEFPEVIVRTVNVGSHRIQKLEVYAERNRNIVVVLHPMRKIDRDMNAAPRHHFVRDRTVLVFGPKDRSIVVDRPEALDFFLWKDVFIVAIEDVKRLRSADLKEKVALAINMIRCHAPRRGYEYDDVFLPDLSAGSIARDLLDLSEPAVKQFPVFGIALRVPEDEPCV